MKKTWFVSSLLLLASWGLPSLAVPPSVTKTKPQLTQTAQPVATKAKVELLNPGAQPRQVLRYQPVVNAKQLATMTMNMNMKMSLSGKSFPAKLPSTVMKVETTVTQVAPNGDIYYTFRYVDIDVTGKGDMSPAVMQAMRSEFKKLTGIQGTCVISNRGQVKSSNFKVPANVDKSTKQLLEQMSQTLAQLSSPLPESAIGVGAKWRVTQPLQMSGMNLTQTETYELVGVKDNVATLKESFTQEARSQTLNQPGLPKGVTIALKSLNSTGEGQAVLRLDRLMPTQATASVTSISQMETSSPQLTTPMLVDAETQIDAILTSP